MELQNKNRLIFWILFFLVIVNLSAIATFFIISRGSDNPVCDAADFQCGKAFEFELGLSPEQAEQVGVINSEYHTRSRPIANEIRQIRSEILDELSSERPDTSFIEVKSNELCDFQLQLQQLNFTQFLELKKVCDPEQAQRLSALYRELYGCARMSNQEGRMHRHRPGRK